MAECKECGGYTKYKNGYCSKCYNQIKKKEKQSKDTPQEKKDSKELGFPSHTELYRDLHLVEDYMQEIIINKFTDEKIIKLPKFSDYRCHNSLIEEDNWDIWFGINWNNERDFEKFQDYLDNDDSSVSERFIDEYQKKRYAFYIEYKSSINEWGKQIDQFFRQIKDRLKSQKIHEKPILLSFDESFLDYEQACKRAGIVLVILPHWVLFILQGETREEREERAELIAAKLKEKGEDEDNGNSYNPRDDDPRDYDPVDDEEYIQ